MGSQKRIPAKERRPQAYAMWCDGHNQKHIAECFDVSRQQISKDVNSYAASLHEVVGAKARILRMLDEMDEVAAVLLERHSAACEQCRSSCIGADANVMTGRQSYLGLTSS